MKNSLLNPVALCNRDSDMQAISANNVFHLVDESTNAAQLMAYQLKQFFLYAAYDGKHPLQMRPKLLESLSLGGFTIHNSLIEFVTGIVIVWIMKAFI